MTNLRLSLPLPLSSCSCEQSCESHGFSCAVVTFGLGVLSLLQPLLGLTVPTEHVCLDVLAETCKILLLLFDLMTHWHLAKL